MTVSDGSSRRALDHFVGLIERQQRRIEAMRERDDPIDFSKLPALRIAVAGGDGIGPIIADQTVRLLKALLKDEIASGNVEPVMIEGLTVENRFDKKQAVPADVLEQIKSCHLLLKGPTETPAAGDPRGELESANVVLRRELDLFANIRPVRIPKDDIDWTFFRENTEGEYILGSQGILLGDLAIDFKIITRPGSERIIRAAFEHAVKTGSNRVTVVTKANVVKTTDGMFLAVAEQAAKDYPQVKWDDWYIDIMTAKLLDPARRSDFKVVVLPNLYGDILTDEAAQLQGGVGTAGSANIGNRYSMFEAVHGSGTRMIEDGRGDYADPSSLMRAAAMMLTHAGMTQKAAQLSAALDKAQRPDSPVKITGRSDGTTAKAYTNYVIEGLE